MSHVRAAAVRAMTTIQVAHRSASLTILALPASVDWTGGSSADGAVLATLVARRAPNCWTVPLETCPPPLSTGRDCRSSPPGYEVWPLV
ncbi:MAG: hypothetical protein ACLRWL_09335 [Evtepia gabavorous]